MEIFQHFWFLCFTYILSGMQSVSGCITTQFLNNNKDLKLSCPIATFTSSGIWTVNGVQITSCQSGGFCSTVSTGNYTFTSNTAGIYIVMDPYSSDEAGKNWTCTHLLSICSILVESPSESSGNSDGNLGAGEIVGIVLGCLAPCAIAVFFLIVCIWMFVVGRKRHERTENDEATFVCCCACCWSFLVRVTCNLFVNKTRTEIDPTDIEEFVYVKKNTNIEFGKPIPFATNARWEKDGNKVETTHTEYTIFTIVNASVNHEGLYTCTLNDLRMKYYLIVVGRTEMVYVKEDEEVELGKTIPGIESIPVVKWMKDKHDVIRYYLDSNKLKIMNASLHDEGTYVCTFGTNRNKLTYLLIIVGPERTINVIEGKQIEFGKDIPASVVTSDAYWTKDGNPVESTSHKKTFYHIDAVDVNSHGLYICHLGNKAELKYRLIKSE